MLIHGLVGQGGLQWVIMLTKVTDCTFKETKVNSEHHLHCTICSIYPAPGASRPHCRLFNNEFRLPDPLIVVAFLLAVVLLVVVVY